MRSEKQIGEVFIFPKENLNIHWRPGKSVNEASSIRGATWLNTVLYFIYGELIFQSKRLMRAYKKHPWGEEKKTTGTPTLPQPSNWSVSDFIRNVLGKLCQGSAQTWVPALKARLTIAQSNICALFMTSWAALPQEFLFGTMKIGRGEESHGCGTMEFLFLYLSIKEARTFSPFLKTSDVAHLLFLLLPGGGSFALTTFWV